MTLEHDSRDRREGVFALKLASQSGEGANGLLSMPRPVEYVCSTGFAVEERLDERDH
jgi:hypothetical protein